MDRSLDDVISSRQDNSRSRSRRSNFPRDGVRKSSQRDSPRNIDQDWVHDKYNDDDTRESYNTQPARRRGAAGVDQSEAGFKVKVENLHYEISEDDLKELFSRIGRVHSASLVYDRQDRSKGIGYVTYLHLEDAVSALNEYNGQKAYGQTIYLTMLPTTAARPTAIRNPPSRSLFDRIERPLERRIRDDRSRSPHVRHSDVTKPPPEHIDRYIPGGGGAERRRSPSYRGGRGGGRGGGGGSRRPGMRRDLGGRSDDTGRQTVQGRPRKTQEELDAEMDDYWGKTEKEPINDGEAATGGHLPVNTDEDVMIE